MLRGICINLTLLGLSASYLLTVIGYYGLGALPYVVAVGAIATLVDYTSSLVPNEWISEQYTWHPFR